MSELRLELPRAGRKRFATCPLTENGLIRIVDHPKYPNSPGHPGAVVQLLVAIRSLPGHTFSERLAAGDHRAHHFTILMPHPERGFLTVQHSWHPADWGEDAWPDRVQDHY